MDPITFLNIELQARKISNGSQPSVDDYKDAIVEYHMHEVHLSDEEVDDLFYVFDQYRSTQQIGMFFPSGSY